MDRKEECKVQPEHLVESHEVMTKEEGHGDSLKECVEHDKAVPDDR
jgi:hypothetical protein